MAVGLEKMDCRGSKSAVTRQTTELKFGQAPETRQGIFGPLSKKRHGNAALDAEDQAE